LLNIIFQSDNWVEYSR